MKMDFKKMCRTCANQGTFNDGSPGCVKFKIKVDLNKDFCSWHADKDVPTCIICGATENLIIINNDDDIITVCQEHHDVYYSCQTCENLNKCEFKQDQSEPPYIMQQVRQGPMVIQQQVKNPTLVQRHCPKCCCSSKIDGQVVCVKENQGYACPSWRPRK